MIKWILTALALLGVGRPTTAPAAADKSTTSTTTAQPTAPSPVPVQPNSDGRGWP